MYKIEMQLEDRRWVALGGRYGTKQEAESAVSRFLEANTVRKNGVVYVLRNYRTVRA